MRNLLKKVSNKKKGGFTLVEILVVILIIGILAITLIPKIGNSATKAKETGVKTRFNEFRTASTMLLQEKAGFKKIMNSDDDVNTVAKFLNGYLDPAVQFDTTTIQGQYCNSHAKDPWNNVYRLHVSANHSTGEGTITFMSYGPSGNTANAEGFNKESAGADYVLSVSYDDGSVIVNSEGIEVGSGNGGNNGGTANGNEGTPGENGGTGSGTENNGNQEEVQDEIISGTGTLGLNDGERVSITDNETGETYKVFFAECPSVSNYDRGTEGSYSLNNTTRQLISFTVKGDTASGIGQVISASVTESTIQDEISGKTYTVSGKLDIGAWGSYSITNGVLDYFNIIDHYGWETGTITDKTLVNQLEHTIQVRLDGTVYNLSRSKVTINQTRYNLSKNCENCDLQYCDYCNNALASVPTGEVWYKISGGEITAIDTK